MIKKIRNHFEELYMEIVGLVPIEMLTRFHASRGMITELIQKEDTHIIVDESNKDAINTQFLAHLSWKVFMFEFDEIGKMNTYVEITDFYRKELLHDRVPLCSNANSIVYMSMEI